MKYPAMKKRYPLLIVGLILVGLSVYIFYAVFIPFMVNRDKTSFPSLQLIVGGLIWFFIVGAGLELTLVGLGYYQNQYTGSRMFKGILY